MQILPKFLLTACNSNRLSHPSHTFSSHYPLFNQYGNWNDELVINQVGPAVEQLDSFFDVP